jgi:Zn-dependent M28 family amino/carboxypeptidase
VRNRLFIFAIILVALANFSFAQATKTPTSKLFDAAQLLNDIKTLSADDMEGRSADRTAMQKARNYVVKRFHESCIEAMGSGSTQEFEIKRRGTTVVWKGINYYGVIKGKKTPEKYIIITAHYDHDGIKDGEIYNGADDNASGTAALFAIASYFNKHQPDNSLIFVAFDAEEKGLVGARHFVTNIPVAKEFVLLNVNMDMIARNDKGELYAAGTFPYPHLKPALLKAQKKAKVKLILGHDDPATGRDNWTNQSDQGAFHAAKIPFIYFGVEDHADYHRPTDDFERIHTNFYVSAVETILQTIEILDKAKAKP